MLTRSDLETAAAFVHARMAPTPQHQWPLLSAATGAEVWVKHENHTPTGAFKVRGALTFMDWLTRTHPDVPGICTATRGNHGQGQDRQDIRDASHERLAQCFGRIGVTLPQELVQ